jgi:hypothetical protein
MNKDEALRLALEALEKLDRVMKRSPDTDKAIIAIKQALAQEKALQALHNENERLGLYKDAYGQPEPEPVALGHKEKDKYEFVPTAKWFGKLPDGVHHLYTSPPKREWQGLTDEEFQYCVELKNPESIAEEVEAKLKEKNT